VEDAAALRQALSAPEVWTHIPGGPLADDDAARSWVQATLDRGWFPWTVRLRQPAGDREIGQVVGWTSFLDIVPNDARLEIGNTAYAAAVWGSVVNPETKLLLLTDAFEGLGMGRVQLKTDIRNHRSQQAIARLGAQFVGVLRRYQRRTDGTVRDTVMFSITAEEWPSVRAGLESRIG
jgi:RimJ/RimL family protein N-acetyltransferase